MNSDSRVVYIPVIILLIIVAACGCAWFFFVLPPAAGQGECDPYRVIAHNGSEMLLNEANRQLDRMNSSNYTHATSVNEINGSYRYDCSGFAGYALARADPCAFSALMHTRPDAADFYYDFIQFKPVPGKAGWMRVPTPAELRPGDLIAWLTPESSDADSTGHIMIVAGNPVENPGRSGEMLVQVIDSTLSAHADDTRGPGQTGLGKGTIGIMTQPQGYYWRGGESRVLQETEMVFARIA